jgi:hypothetical protein
MPSTVRIVPLRAIGALFELGADGLLIDAGQWEIGRGGEGESNLVDGCCHLAPELEGPDPAARDCLTDVILPEGEGAGLRMVRAESAAEPSKNSAINWSRADKVQTFPAKQLLPQNVPFENYLGENPLGDILPFDI